MAKKTAPGKKSSAAEKPAKKNAVVRSKVKPSAKKPASKTAVAKKAVAGKKATSVRPPARSKKAVAAGKSAARPKTAAKPKAKAKAKAAAVKKTTPAKAKPAAGKKPVAKPKAAARPKTTVKARPKPAAKPKGKPAPKSKTKPVAKPKPKPVVKAAAKPKPASKQAAAELTKSQTTTRQKEKLVAKIKSAPKSKPKSSALPKPAKPATKTAAKKKAKPRGPAVLPPRPKPPSSQVIIAPKPVAPSFDINGYLDDLDRFGMKLGLTRIQKLLKELGNPEKKLKVIHIVGSNGKSSTARMLAAILTGQGIKTGAYLSPHLVDFPERFLINGKEIGEKPFEKLILQVKKAAEEVNSRSRSSGPLTQFEILTAAAFLYFHQQKVGAAVIEAGLGGRYDATNVTDSKVQVLTNVVLEHTDVLGETVPEIVREKAAVIPEKGNVVLGAMSDEALAEAMKICQRNQARVVTFDDDYSLLKGRGDMFDVWAAKGQYSDLSLTLFGEYQRTNCAVAVQAAEVFMRKQLDEKKLKRALLKISIPARMEVISDKPMIILDGAHNPAGIEELLKSLAALVQTRRILCVVSILKDKDAATMLGRLLEFCDILFITENSNPRCSSAQELSNLDVVKESHVQTFVARESQSALESAFKLASIRDVILVTGSLYLLADIKKRIG